MAKGKNKKVYKDLVGFWPFVGAFFPTYLYHRWFGWSPDITVIPFYAYLVFLALNTIYPQRKKHEDNNTGYYRVTMLFLLLWLTLTVTFFLAGLLTLIYKWLSGFVSNINWSFINIDWSYLFIFSLVFIITLPLFALLIISLSNYLQKWLGYDLDGVPGNPYTPLEDKNLLIQNIIELSGKTSWKAELEKLDIEALNDIHEKLNRHRNE